MASTINDRAQITDELVNYLASEIQKVAELGDLEIENYADQEIMNPEVQKYLESSPDSEGMTLEELEASGELLTLSSLQMKRFNASSAAGIFGLRFRKLKRKIKRIFCEVVPPLIGDGGQIDLPDIIKAVLIALIPALAGSGGLAVVLLPIVIAIIAKLVKRGIDTVCPV